MIDQDFLKEHFSYDPETGLFTVIKLTLRNRRSKVGNNAGFLKADGYLSISIFSVLYKAHRLAWLYMYGSLPNDHIDHINGDRTDNRANNLRCVSQAGNNQNLHKAKKSNKTSGLLGVSFERFTMKYRAQIVAQGKTKSLGRFDTKEAAHEAYLKAKRELHLTCTI